MVEFGHSAVARHTPKQRTECQVVGIVTNTSPISYKLYVDSTDSIITRGVNDVKLVRTYDSGQYEFAEAQQETFRGSLIFHLIVMISQM